MKRYRRILKGLRNSDLAFRFLDHLGALGLSRARICKYASHLIVLLRVIDFSSSDASRSDVERVASWINSQPYSDWTKHDQKIVLKKLIQYAKYGRCDRGAPLPSEDG